MNKSKLSLFIFFTIFTSSAMAVCLPSDCRDEYVDKLYVDRSGIIYFTTTGDEAILNCDLTGNIYMKLSADTPGKDGIYSTLLAAFVSDKKVQVRIIEGSQGCEVAYITLARP